MIRFDAVKHRLDANETLFFSRQLESIEAKMYEAKQREMKSRRYIPVSNRDNPGAETITYRMYDKVGMAKIISSYSDDLPRVDVFATEYTNRVKGIGASFGYSMQEIRAARMAGIDLDTSKIAAVRRAFDEKENKIVWTGDAEHGIIGLLANTNITSGLVANNAGGTSRLWINKTALEIIKDVRLAITAIRTASKEVHNANTLLLPSAQYDLISMTPMSENNPKTILQFILENKSFGLTTIDTLLELDNAFAGGTLDGMFLYEKDPDVLEQRIPLERMIHPGQDKNLEIVFPCESRHGGTVVRYPLACYFAYGI